MAAFRDVNEYTAMSLCDLIFHICSCFKDKSVDFAIQVVPHLIGSFEETGEERLNSIFSIIGKRRLLSLLDSLHAIVSIIGQKVEPYRE